jgi:hypothetical protein
MICFTRGQSFYQVARAQEGFVGYRDGRIIATAADRAAVVRALLDRTFTDRLPRSSKVTAC